VERRSHHRFVDPYALKIEDEDEDEDEDGYDDEDGAGS
jgi:hypothetical protein